MTPETKIRYQSLLVALQALNEAGEDIEISSCHDCGTLRIIGESGVVEPNEDGFIFIGVDGSEMYV